MYGKRKNAASNGICGYLSLSIATDWLESVFFLPSLVYQKRYKNGDGFMNSLLLFLIRDDIKMKMNSSMWEKEISCPVQTRSTLSALINSWF